MDCVRRRPEELQRIKLAHSKTEKPSFAEATEAEGGAPTLLSGFSQINQIVDLLICGAWETIIEPPGRGHSITYKL